jgi:DNA-binding NtrC family response regulator
MLSILIVEDSPTVGAALTQMLKETAETEMAPTLQHARDSIARRQPDVILLDEQLPDGSGLEFFRELRANATTSTVIFITASNDVQLAVEAMRQGAFDFLTKPIDQRALRRSVDSIQQRQKAPRERYQMVRSSIIGSSSAMGDLWRQIEIFAPTDISILLLGESGVGKELFARAIHNLSGRADEPFIELDCASLPQSLIESELFGHEKGAFTDAREMRKGKFELASGGTLFLDELGNLSPDVQAKLLRVVQERTFRRLGGAQLVEVDIRIIAATNLDLRAAMDRQAFRSDLYFRLAELPLNIPPLRERTGDVELLVHHFLTEYARVFHRNAGGVSPAAMALLKTYDWPGNVRELRNAIRVATLMLQDKLEPQHLPGYFPRDVAVRPAISAPPEDFDPFAPGATEDVPIRLEWAPREAGLDLKELNRQARHQLERHIFTVLTTKCGLNKTQIARYLGIDYKILLQKFKDVGLD